MVGAHWFSSTWISRRPVRFDGENQNFGLVKITDEPWPEVTARFQAVDAEAAPRRVLAPGGNGSAPTDCVVEWAATAPLAPVGTRRRVPPARFRCRDGDPKCDTDMVAGQCTIEIAPCAGVSDARLPACMPAAPDFVQAADRSRPPDAALTAALAASLQTVQAAAAAAPGACGPAVRVPIALGGGKRSHHTLRVLAQSGARPDRDKIRLTCERAAP